LAYKIARLVAGERYQPPPLGFFVASAVMLLVDNAYMTGQTVALSGGMTFN
jgi:hypothetical protein